MTDDGGVLGNLPNSRPGKRSAKREAGAGRPAKSAAKAAEKAEAGGKPAAKAEAGGKPAAKAASKRPKQPKRTTAVKKPASGDSVVVDRDMRGKVRHDPVPPPASEDPVGAAVRTAAGITVAGVKVAGAVGRELFKRLPRP
jgi:hypothetical protein